MMADTRANILVADGYEQLRDVVASVLSAAGHRVRTAGSGRHVRAILEQGGVDLVLFDLCLPDMDTRELRQALRDVGAAETPIVATTANPPGPVQQAALGVAAVLAKPFQLCELLDVVGGLLGQRSAAEAA